MATHMLFNCNRLKVSIKYDFHFLTKFNKIASMQQVQKVHRRFVEGLTTILFVKTYSK